MECKESNRGEWKRRIAPSIILFAGSLLLFAAIFLSRGIYEMAIEQQGPVSMQKVTISMNNDRNASGNGLTPREAEKLQKELNADAVCYSVQCFCEAAAGKNFKPARVTGTTELAPIFSDIAILRGSFFSGADDREESRVAVIEDRLAWELYRNNEVLGCDIRLFGKRFKVIGVMESDRSVSGQLTDEGSFQVYIPVRTCLELNLDSRISYFQYRTDSESVIGRNADDVQGAFSSLGRDPGTYRIVDYNISGTASRQKPKLLVLLMGLSLISVLLLVSIRNARRTVLRIREECRTDYFFSALIACKVEMIRSLLLLSFAVLSAILVWKLVWFPVYIPPELIPDDFTDLSYYSRLFQKKIMENLSDKGNVPPFPEIRACVMQSLLNRVFYISFVSGAVLFPVGLIWSRKEEDTPERCMITGGILVAADAAVLLLLSHAAGLPVRMEIKELFVFWLFLFTSQLLQSARHGNPEKTK